MERGRFIKVLHTAAWGIGGALVASSVVALEPANYQAGPVFLTPTVESRLGYVDNLLRSKDDEKSTGMSTIKPRVQAWLQNGLNTYSFTYELANYTYFDSSDDNFTDNIFNLDVHHEFNARNVVNLFGEYYAGHEERGTGLTEGLTEDSEAAELIDKPVELDRTIIGGDYTYGSQASRGRVKLAARGTEHDYQNYDRYTRYRNRDEARYDGTLFWRVAPRTDALAEVRYIDTEYDQTNPRDSAGSLDSEEFNYLVGLTWEATAKTSGSVKVGMFDRTYDSGARSDDDGFSWEVDVTYRPRTYSSFNLESRRFSDETNGLGNAVDANKTTLTWKHEWNTRSSTSLSLGGGTEDYTGSPREDDVFNVEASYNYRFRRWVDFGLGYRFEDRDSGLKYYDYSRNEVFMEARLSL
jgi:polysaccharide biosynthesis protein VpsM